MDDKEETPKSDNHFSIGSDYENYRKLQKPLKKVVTRRKLLKIGGAAVATAAVTTGGLATGYKAAEHLLGPLVKPTPRPVDVMVNSTAIPPKPNEEVKIELKPQSATPSPSKKPTATVPPTEVVEQPQPTPQPVIEAEKPLQLYKNELNDILQKPLNSEERYTAEENYLRLLTKVPDSNPNYKLQLIDQGFWTITKREFRAYLLDLRYQLRESGCLKLKSLPQEVITWAENNDIHPEILGICMDAKEQAILLLTQLKAQKGAEFWKYFRADLIAEFTSQQLEQFTIDDLMINPGGMAELVCTETKYKPYRHSIFEKLDQINPWRKKTDFRFPTRRYGFAKIGSLPAMSQLYHKDQEVLGKWRNLFVNNINKLAVNTGLNFNPQNTPGSERPSPNDSGGAIGLQFMPETISEISKMLEGDFQIIFNPFDPVLSVVGAYLFLAMGEPVGNDFKIGFLDGPNEVTKNNYEFFQTKAIQRWNSDNNQIAQVIKAIKNYRREILQLAA